VPKPILWLVITISAVVLVTALAPLEETLGAGARIVYLHGAWVWVAMLLFGAAALTGLGGLLTQKTVLHEWSRALGHTALLFWIAFLLMSLYVMQVNWNGIFWAEPRFRIPLNLAVIGLLLQVGLTFLPLSWTSLGNIAYAIALGFSMSTIEAILHPLSPVFSSDASGIQLFFIALLILLALFGFQVAHGLRSWEHGRSVQSEAE
jgi:hypothetical protein